MDIVNECKIIREVDEDDKTIQSAYRCIVCGRIELCKYFPKGWKGQKAFRYWFLGMFRYAALELVCSKCKR